MHVSGLMGVSWMGPFVNVADWVLELELRPLLSVADWVCLYIYACIWVDVGLFVGVIRDGG